MIQHCSHTINQYVFKVFSQEVTLYILKNIFCSYVHQSALENFFYILVSQRQVATGHFVDARLIHCYQDRHNHSMQNAKKSNSPFLTQGW